MQLCFEVFPLGSVELNGQGRQLIVSQIAKTCSVREEQAGQILDSLLEERETIGLSFPGEVELFKSERGDILAATAGMQQGVILLRAAAI